MKRRILYAVETRDGFVHFSDEKRVAYNEKGAIGRSFGWTPITPTHIRLANQFLKAQGMLSTND